MDFKDLEKLLKLARKYGLQTVKTPEIEFTVDLSFANNVSKRHKTQIVPFGVSEDDKIDLPNELSPEDLLFYSASGQQVPEQQ